MRKFKFRAWDTEKQEMATVNFIGLNDYEVGMEDEECRRWRATYPYVCRLRQYIGLEDKNGRKIYEGDIITITLDTGNVITGSVGMNNGQWSIKYYDRYYPLASIWYEMQPEVIGNIYENSELLERKNEVK